MGEPNQPVQLSFRELMELRESAWSKRLKGVSLAAECLASPDHTEQALTVLAKLLDREASPVQRARVLRRWPAVHVITTVGVGTEHYEHGTFWPSVSRIAGLSGQGFQSEWGEAFLDNLLALELPDFSDIEDPGARFVGPILMHSGVPTYCLADYFQLVVDRRRGSPGLEPDEFVSWAAARAAENRLYGIDKPVQRFLRYGGEYAVDVSDRIFDLLDQIATGGSGEDVPLPDRFRTAALEYRDSGLLDGVETARSSTGADNGGSQMPSVRLDPWGRGPFLQLPSVDAGDDGVATWSVTLDAADSQTVRSRPSWPGEPAPPTTVAFLYPVRSASVSIARSERLKITIPVVDDKDRLLVFSEDGRLLPPRLSLPPTASWLLFPGTPDELVIDGPIKVQAEGVLPGGWTGWSLVLLDLTGVSSVRGPGSQRVRNVRRAAEARIVTGEPLQGLRSRFGAPVFASIPEIVLPPSGDGATEWMVSVAGRDGSVLAQRQMRDGDDPASIWSEVPRPLLGTHHIRVRGPWGRGASREVFLAEGLSAEFNPPWRRISALGLVPARASLRCSGSLRLDRMEVDFGETDIQHEVTAITPQSSLRLTVTPPHMTVSYESSESFTTPSIRPVNLHAEDVRYLPGHLVVGIGAQADPALSVFSGRTVIQEIRPSGPTRHGIFRFDLARLTDTLARHPRVRLALDETATMVVASVTPRRLHGEVTASDGLLHIADSVDVPGLTALVYPIRAPWRGAHPVSVADGVAALPDLLRHAGPLFVSVRIEDPWAPAAVPSWPDPATAVLLHSSGWIRGDEEETVLSAYLADGGPFPSIITRPERLLTILGRLPTLALGDRRHDVEAACSRALRQLGTRAIEGLATAGLDAATQPGVLIRAGLLAAHLPEQPMSAAAGWSTGSTLSATLRWATHLSRHPELVPPDVIADARSVFGDVMDALLAGHDPYANTGAIDRAAMVYAKADTIGRAEFRRLVRLVPSGLLERDTRVEASFELLDRRKSAPVHLTRQAGTTLRQVTRILEQLKCHIGVSAVRARVSTVETQSWAAFPPLSMGYAFLARLAARGNSALEAWLTANARVWSDLSIVGPKLVTIDIVVAELLLASQESNGESMKNA